MKMTKAQGRRRLAEMQSKAFKLLGAGYMSMKDYEAVRKIVDMRSCLLYTSPSPRDATLSRMPSSA